MRYFSTLISMCLLFSFSVCGQPKPRYTLLWEISGKGLAKPSYLFGTFHSKDRRAFHFSDSVMKALEASKVFVMEVQPDSLVGAQLAREDKKNPSFILGAPDSLMAGGADLAANGKADEMRVFVDAYLYGIARTLRKRVEGLEPPELHLPKSGDGSGNEGSDLLSKLAAAGDPMLERLISIYTQGDLDSLWAVVGPDMQKWDELRLRNVQMGRHIQELIQHDPAFIAVGAAHLPGQDGLIAMLQKAGYRLRPVQATFTGAAAGYSIDYTKMDWQSFTDSVNSFSIKLPVPVFQRGLDGGLHLFEGLDLCSNLGFSVASSYLGPLTDDIAHTLLDTLLTKFLGQANAGGLNRKSLESEGLLGVEVTGKANGGYLVMRVLVLHQFVYAFSVESRAGAMPADVKELFFNSFKSWEPAPAAAASWAKYESQAGAYSVKFPAPPGDMQQQVSDPSLEGYPPPMLYFKTVPDRAAQVNYMIRYNDLPPGMYHQANLQEYYSDVIRQLLAGAEPLAGPEVIYKDGVEGRAFTQLANGLRMEVQLFCKGNRSYLLARQNLKGDGELSPDVFFESFHFEKPARFTPVPFSTGNVDIQMPVKPALAPPVTLNDDSFFKDFASYGAVDPNSGAAYVLSEATFQPYYRCVELDSLHNRLFRSFGLKRGKTDSMKAFTLGTVEGREWFVSDSTAGMAERIRIWVAGNRFYVQTVFSDQAGMGSEQVEQFFSSTRVKPAASSFDLQASKAALIMDDVRSADTLLSMPAFSALRNYYTPDKADFPVLYRALDLRYADDTLAMGVRGRLIDKLIDLHDAAVVPQLKKVYANIDGWDNLRAFVLSGIARIDSTNYDWYLGRLAADRLKPGSNWNLFRPLDDSLAYVAAHLGQLLPLLEFRSYRPNILGLVTNLLVEAQKGSYDSTVIAHKGPLTDKCLDYLDEFALDVKRGTQDENADIDYTSMYHYLSILPKIQVPALLDTFTFRVLMLDSVPYLKTAALATRIESGLPCDEMLVAAQLDSLESRFNIMQAFDKAGKLGSVPIKYRAHAEFARLVMHDYLLDEFDTPKTLLPLGELVNEGSTYFVFEFSYLEDGVTNTYVGVCGPFKEAPGQLNLDAYQAYSDFEKKQDDWRTQAEGMIKDMF